MDHKHEPRDEFVTGLEWRISAGMRHRNRASDVPRWVPRSRWALAAATAGLVLLSMTIGGAAVGVAYQTQTAENRDQLTAAYTQRAMLARLRLQTAMQLVQTVAQRIAVGAASNVDLVDGRLKVTEAEAEVKSIDLQLEEIRQTGLEPVNRVSAPLVSGRDFVGQRWRIEMSVPAAALEAARLGLQDVQTRVSMGVADSSDVDAARGRVVELETTLAAFQRKLEIRQQFLGKAIDAGLADLRVLEADADLRVKILAGKVELGQKELEHSARRVQVGAATQVEQAEAQMRLQGLQYDLSKANYDLVLIRRQIETRGK